MAGVVTLGLEEFAVEGVKELTAKMEWMNDRRMELCSSIEQLTQFVDEAINFGRCALDLETNGLNTRVHKVLENNGKTVIKPFCKIVGYCLSYDRSHGIYVPTSHRVGEEFNLPEKPVIEQIARLCANCVTIYHKSQFDTEFLRNYGIIVEDYNMFEDTLLLARLYDSGQKEIGLKSLSDKLLGQKMLSFDDVTTEKHFDLVSPKVCYIYAVSDAICTLQLYDFFMSQDIIRNQTSIYNLEKRVVPIVQWMERNGIFLDVEYLIELQEKIKNRLIEITENIHQVVGREFNIGSQQQLGKILFEELGYRYPEKNKTASGQYMTDTKTLQKIEDEYPVVKNIIEYRGLDKVSGTYIKKLILNRDEDNKVKMGFNQSGTDTGRFSSPGGKGINIDGYCGVNVQSLPAKGKDSTPKLLKEFPIRKAFIAPPGHVIVAADYSGEELRVTCNLSREPKWLDEFENGTGDIHSITGRTILNKPAGTELTKPERTLGKTINFLIVYGGGPRALAANAKIKETEARRMMANFFAGLPTLKKWIELERVKARKVKLVKTAMGRIRPLHIFYNSGDKASEAHGDRCAVNTLVQGVSADIMKTAMVRVYNWIFKNNLQDEIKMLITVHDEIVFSMPEDKINEYIPKINSIMKLNDILQGILKWPVGLQLDAEYGKSWDVDHDFFKEHPELDATTEDIKFVTNNQLTAEDTEIKKEPEPDQKKESEAEKDPSQKSDPTEEKSEELTIVPISQEVSEDTKIDKVDMTPASLTEGKKVETVDAPVSEENYSILKPFVYTLRNRQKSSLRRINDIIMFLTDDNRNGNYPGPKGLLRLKDQEGNSLLVSDIKIPIDAFMALARYMGI